MTKKQLPFERLEAAVGYTFKDKEILKKALTHSSYSNECRSKGVTAECNERLEFLGDSVLSIAVSRYLFDKYADRQEGDLTKIRAAVVCEKALSKYARDISLGSYIFLGHGEDMNRGRERASILADAFEALLAAIYIDSGRDMASVETFLMPYVTAEIDAVGGEYTSADFGVFPVPYGDNQIIVETPCGPSKFVYSGSKNIDAAKQYMAFLASPESLQYLIDNEPSFNDMPFSGLNSSYNDEIKAVVAAYKTGESAVYQNCVNYLNPQWMEVGADIASMFMGEMTAEEVIANMDLRRADQAKAAGDPNWQ